MLRTLPFETGFERVCGRANSANRPIQPPWPVQTALIGLFDGLLAGLDGLAAYRHFEHLRARGIAHDTALRCALGVGVHLRG